MDRATNWNAHAKSFRRSGRLSVALVALSISACSGGDFYDIEQSDSETPLEDTLLDAKTLEEKQEDLTELLIADGHDPLEIKFFDESLVVQGDMLMHVDDALDKFSGIVEKQSQVRKKEDEGGRVSNVYNDRITVSISRNVPIKWHPDIEAAMAQWNSVRGSRIHFSRKISGHGHVHISMRDIGTDAGYGDYPQARVHLSGFKIKKERQPGPNVYLNYVASSFSASERQSLVMHELGHTIGFDHTFGNFQERNADRGFEGKHISGTPFYDPDSVMVSGGYPEKLSIGDHIATAKVYSNGQAPEFQCYPGQVRTTRSSRLTCPNGQWQSRALTEKEKCFAEANQLCNDQRGGGGCGAAQVRCNQLFGRP